MKIFISKIFVSLILMSYSGMSAGCVTQEDLKETARPDWIKNEPGVLAPTELVAPQKKD